MKHSDKEGHFKSAITLALNKTIPWKTLGVILNEMTPTFEETKQLVKVLLDILQTMQMNLDQKPIKAQDSQIELLEKEPESVEEINNRGEIVLLPSSDGINFELESSDSESYEENEQSDFKI